MLVEVSKVLRNDYKDYIIIIKSGNFYVVFNKDAFILNSILNYKINKVKNGLKVGFPILSLNKVLDRLEKNKINYIVVENSNIVLKKKFNSNRYNNYKLGSDYTELLERIDNISNTLKDNISNDNINKILERVEDVVCMINS